MVQVKKRKKESTHSLIRRFTQRVRQSGVLEKARESMFHQQPKTHRELKEEALYNKKMKKKYDRLRKLGKLDEIQNKSK